MLFFFFFFFLIAYVRFKDCEQGWKFFEQSCYKVFNDTLTQSDSEDQCQKEGGHLVSTTSSAELKFVVGLYLNTSGSYRDFWIGLKKDYNKYGNLMLRRANWTWTDGSVYSWMNWQGSEPASSSDKGCSIRYLDNLWYGRKVGRSHFPRICEKSKLVSQWQYKRYVYCIIKIIPCINELYRC